MRSTPIFIGVSSAAVAGAAAAAPSNNAAHSFKRVRSKRVPRKSLDAAKIRAIAAGGNRERLLRPPTTRVRLPEGARECGQEFLGVSQVREVTGTLDDDELLGRRFDMLGH
jgi:hypothetical protein